MLHGPPHIFCFVAQRGRVIKKWPCPKTIFGPTGPSPKIFLCYGRWLQWEIVSLRSSRLSGWAQIKKVFVPRKWNYRPQHVACDNTSAQTFFAALLWNQGGGDMGQNCGKSWNVKFCLGPFDVGHKWLLCSGAWPRSVKIIFSTSTTQISNMVLI